ncbi:hypothetical protein VKT23_019758 [Stygiomarasmius scandens]|uniref:Uncharacterized protein n=1 Tax=Marasmiellus scandens TaxID=2682957 RepID=A0ABR1IKR7_9AGAR
MPQDRARAQRVAPPLQSALPAPEDAELAKRKRKFDEFADIAHTEIRSNKRNYSDAMRQVQLIGLFWPRGIGLFMEINPVIIDGLAWEKREARRKDGEHVDEEDEDEDDIEEETLVQRRRNLSAYHAMVKRYPAFRRRLLECVEFNAKATITELTDLIQQGYSDARRHDTSKLKTGIVHWLPHAMQINAHYLPKLNFQTRALSASLDKQDRGVNHPLTRAFLIPHTHMHLVYAQSEGEAKAKAVLQDMKRHKIPLDTCSLPAFLYCMKQYNAQKRRAGLLRGPLLVCAFRAIFLGPSAAMGEKVSTKPGNGKIHGINRVTPELIAYIAAQVRFAICAQASWRPKDKKFDLIQFYYYILEIITSKAKDNWRKNLIRFWNMEVFGEDSVSSTLDPPDEDSDMAKLFEEFDNDSDDELEGDDPAPDDDPGVDDDADPNGDD